MTDALQLLLALSAGVLFGCIFFWGLWRTIAGLDKARNPARRMIASLLSRFGIVIGGFYLLARFGGWEHVVAGLIGFTFARLLVMRRTRARSLDTVGREPDA